MTQLTVRPAGDKPENAQGILVTSTLLKGISVGVFRAIDQYNEYDFFESDATDAYEERITVAWDNITSWIDEGELFRYMKGAGE